MSDIKERARSKKGQGSAWHFLDLVALRRALVLLICGLGLVSSPAWAQAQEYGQSLVHWRTDYNFARREAVEKKLPIFIDFYTNPCIYCTKLDQYFFSEPKVAKLLNEHFIPLKINGTSTEANKKLADTLFIGSYPTLVLATHDGKILPPAIVGYREPDQLYEYLLRVNASLSEPEWMLKDLQLAQKFVDAKEYSRAISVLRSIVEDGKTRSVQVSARTILQKLDELGQAHVAQARDMFARGQALEALDVVNDAIRTFTPLQSARDAETLRSQITNSSSINSQLRDRKARELLAQAQDFYKQKEFLLCLDRCDNILREYGDLPAGQAAYEMSINIKSDTQWARVNSEILMERLADLWLALADNYHRTGRPDQARHYYERVYRAFPGSRQADAAQFKLNQLTGPSGRAVPTGVPPGPR